MNLEQIEAIIAKNLTITDQRLMDGVIGAVMDAVAAERDKCYDIAMSEAASGSLYGWPECAYCIAKAIRARGEK